MVPEEEEQYTQQFREFDVASEFPHENSGIKLFVGQIPKDLDEKQLIPFFSEFGPVSEIRIIRDKSNQGHKGCAFLTYVSAHSALKAVEHLHDKMILPNATNPLQVRIAESQAERENKLFIGMLPKTINEEDLHDMFVPYGDLREVHIIRGSEGSSKGCAFVKFVDREAALVAIEDMNNMIPAGSTRPLVVKFADNKKQGGVPSGVGVMGPLGGGRKGVPLGEMQGVADGSYMSAPSSHHLLQQSKPAYWPPRQQQQQQQMMYPFGMPNSAPQGGGGGFMFDSPVSHGLHSGPGLGSSPPQYVYMTNSGYGYPQAFSPPSSPVLYGQSGNTGSRRQQPSQQFPNSKGGPVGIPPPVRLPKAAYGSISDARQHEFDGGDGVGRGGSGGGFDGDYEFRDGARGGGGIGGIHNSRPPEGPPGANLFIYHLPRDLTDADLATLFANFGNVISAKVFVDKKTSDSKGFGFVSYDLSPSAEAAIAAMNGFQIGSKRLKVQHKRTVYDDMPIQQHHHSMPAHAHGGHHMYMYPDGGSELPGGGDGLPGLQQNGAGLQLQGSYGGHLNHQSQQGLIQSDPHAPMPGHQQHMAGPRMRPVLHESQVAMSTSYNFDENRQLSS